jgi:RimJ/RimL family protein N-acetyltransferase
LKLLETERIYLRYFTAQDAGLFFELDSDPEVMRYISKGQPTSMERVQNDILPRLLAFYSQSPPTGFWAAHLRATDEFFGWFHLRPDKLEPELTEIGYRLTRKSWGRGLATEGSRALLKKGFTEWNRQQIVGRTLVVNLASRRVLEKIGLHFESEFFYPAEMTPGWSHEERRAVKYSLKKEDFRPKLEP